MFRILKSIAKKIRSFDGRMNLNNYWRQRAKMYGKYSVINMAHGIDGFDLLTEFQKKTIFPLFRGQLRGDESLILDFGCGPGRFTDDLAQLISGNAIGVDITPELIDIAPRSDLTSYQCISGGILPFEDKKFDVVWCSLVLGGIPAADIEGTIAEIDRVLKPGGLFFFIENTADATNASYWFFRGETAYIELARFCNPKKIGSYEDLGQMITIFSGRKT